MVLWDMLGIVGVVTCICLFDEGRAVGGAGCDIPFDTHFAAIGGGYFS